MQILIVDDEKEFRQSLADLVELETNHHVTLAANGKQALELCRNNRYDLLVVDYRMPIMDGVEFFLCLNREQNLNRESKIVFLSGFIDEVSFHIKDVVSVELKSKPIDPVGFLNMLQEMDEHKVAA